MYILYLELFIYFGFYVCFIVRQLCPVHFFFFKNKPSLLEIVGGNLWHDGFKVNGGLAFWPDIPENQENVLQTFSELNVQPDFSERARKAGVVCSRVTWEKADCLMLKHNLDIITNYTQAELSSIMSVLIYHHLCDNAGQKKVYII